MLVTCLFTDIKMLLTLTLLIETITYFIDRSFMVMFNQDFTLFLLLMIF